MNKSILPPIETPNSCYNCRFSKDIMDIDYEDKTICAVNDMNVDCCSEFNYLESRHQQCPLQNTTELLEVLEELKRFTSNGVQVNTAYNKLYKALGGNNDK